MNTRFASLLALVPALGCLPAAAPAQTRPAPAYEGTVDDSASDELYDPANLPRFDIEIGPESMESLRREPREQVRALFRYKGVVLSDIGIRLKGEYSFRPVDVKPSFRIKFDEFVAGQRSRGLSRMVLHNTIQDPSFLSERLAYRVYREAGLPAPRANSALVYVNGTYFGLYTNVEAIDKRFLARWFASNKGNLYEEVGLDFEPGAENQFELETNEERNDRRDLAGFIAALESAAPATFMEEVGAHLDVERFVRYAALEAVVGQEDGYAFGAGKTNNFRIYNDPSSGRFTFIPSGIDRALRPPNSPALFHEWVPPPPTYFSPWEASGRVLVKCVASPACREAYQSALKQTAALLASLNLGADIARLERQIRAAVAADNRKELDGPYFDYALETMREYVAGRPTSIMAEMP